MLAKDQYCKRLYLCFTKQFLCTGQTQKMNLFQSITSALDNALSKDPTAGIVSLHLIPGTGPKGMVSSVHGV